LLLLRENASDAKRGPSAASLAGFINVALVGLRD